MFVDDRAATSSRYPGPSRSVPVLRFAKALLDGTGDNAESGQSVIEFALTLPLLLLLVFGITTFAIAMNNYLMLTNSTNIGARQLGISRGQTTDPCALASTAVANASPLLKSASLTYAYVLNGTAYSGTSCSSSSTSTGAAGNLQQGVAAKLTVTYPCTLKIIGTNFAPGCLLTAQTTELVQ